jgi:hypothetical protein
VVGHREWRPGTGHDQGRGAAYWRHGLLTAAQGRGRREGSGGPACKREEGEKEGGGGGCWLGQGEGMAWCWAPSGPLGLG